MMSGQQEPGNPRSTRTRALRTAFSEMPLGIKLALTWMLFYQTAIYTRLDRLLGQSLPLQDPFYQPFLFEGKKPVEGPSSAHILGTDVLSRDNFSRLLHGSWVSLIVAATVVSFGVTVGAVIGAAVGYIRGRWEAIVLCDVDVIIASQPWSYS